MAGIHGEFRHQIDEKGRFRIPAKLKELLGENPFITRGSNRSLIVLRAEDAEKMFDERFGNIDALDPENNKAFRILSSGGFNAEEDKQGRILLPQALIKYAGIVKNIVSIGLHKRVEIWSEEAWEKYIDLTPEEFDACLKSSRPPEANHA